jgi:hypothetical protein
LAKEAADKATETKLITKKKKPAAVDSLGG